MSHAQVVPDKGQCHLIMQKHIALLALPSHLPPSPGCGCTVWLVARASCFAYRASLARSCKHALLAFVTAEIQQLHTTHCDKNCMRPYTTKHPSDCIFQTVMSSANCPSRQVIKIAHLYGCQSQAGYTHLLVALVCGISLASDPQ